jgi:hypothetical protein
MSTRYLFSHIIVISANNASYQYAHSNLTGNTDKDKLMIMIKQGNFTTRVCFYEITRQVQPC